MIKIDSMSIKLLQRPKLKLIESLMLPQLSLETLIKNWDRSKYRLRVLRKGSLCIPVRKDYQVPDPNSQLCMES